MLSRIIEEILPFVSYLVLKRRITSELHNSSKSDTESNIISENLSNYLVLQEEILNELLVAEQERAEKLDDKTFKFASAIATALTLASAATTAVAQLIPELGWKIATVGLALPAIVFAAAGGVLGLAAAGTLPMYGVGAKTAVSKATAEESNAQRIEAYDLACQERINVLRVARNEAAFMSIRNSFLLILLALSVALLGSAGFTKDTGNRPYDDLGGVTDLVHSQSVGSSVGNPALARSRL